MDQLGSDTFDHFFSAFWLIDFFSFCNSLHLLQEDFFDEGWALHLHMCISTI